MDYSKAFRVIRATFGLRQAELARRLRIGASQLSLIEAGRRQPSLKTLEDFAQAFQIPKALIMVLASESSDLEGQSDRDVNDLARALLRLLVVAGDERSSQTSLPFAGEKS